MSARERCSSGYIFSGLRILIVAAGAFFGFAAQAQVSPNIQTQANIVAPPVTLVTPNSTTVPASADEYRIFAGRVPFRPELNPKPGECPPTDKQIIDFVVQKVLPQTAEQRMRPLDLYSLLGTDPDRLREIVTRILKTTPRPRIQIPPNWKCTRGQPTGVKASFTFNPTYETNALKTGSNSSKDFSAGFGGSVLVTTGVGEQRPYDLIFLNAQSASSRYVTYSSKDLDVFSTQAAYQYLIGAYYYDKSGQSIFVDRTHLPSSSAVTYDTASFGVFNQALFTPTFRTKSADLFTPQFTVGRQNLDLNSGHGAPCMPGSSSSASAAGNFCYYMDSSITVGQTFSDTITLQNANVAAAVTLGARIDRTDWTVAGQAMVTGRFYENVPGGRQDVLVQGGPVFTYSAAAVQLFGDTKQQISFSLPINYYQNYSTVSKDSWGGLIIQPTITIAFVPPIH